MQRARNVNLLEYFILVLHIVAYSINQMGELKNQELPNDLKLIEIGNFRPFTLP